MLDTNASRELGSSDFGYDPLPPANFDQLPWFWRA